MDELSYIQGSNQALVGMLSFVLRELDFDETDMERKYYAWIEERQAAVNQLRQLCDKYGDNDWPDSLHLGDVIEKHLARPLDEDLTFP